MPTIALYGNKNIETTKIAWFCLFSLLLVFPLIASDFDFMLLVFATK